MKWMWSNEMAGWFGKGSVQMSFTIRIGIFVVGLLPLSQTAFAGGAEVIRLNPEIHARCLEVLRAGLQGEEFWPSIHAAEGLTLGGYGDEVLRSLTPRLSTESDDQRRCGIARELVRAGARQYAGLMLGILAGKDPHGHIHAAESLYKVAEIGDGSSMRAAFTQDENLRLKLMAAGALGRCGNNDAMSFLRQSLRGEDADRRRIASWILGRIGTQSDVPMLRQQLLRSDDKLSRAYIQHSMASLGDAEGHRALAANLSDTDPAIRTYAAAFAGDARATEAADKLKIMLSDSHPDAAIRAAQSLLVLASPPAADPNEDISQLLYQATKQNPRYTEGSVISLNNGDLLFAVTEFRDTASDFSKARIVGRRSSDGGRSWQDKIVLQENTGGMNVMSASLRRLPNNSIALFYLQKNSHSDLRLYLRTSSDEAITFSEPVRVTGDAGYHVVNNDRITILRSGRLLAPAASTPDVQRINHFVSHCYISDDNGVTWRNGKGHVDADRRGAMEPEVVQLSDGRLLMLIRTQLGFIGKSYSDDGGETWSKMTSLGVRGPEAPSTLRRIPSTGDLLLIWNNCFVEGADHGGKRTPLTAAISRDEGQSWTVVGNLETNPAKTFSYTSLTFSGDRAVMSYWESGPAAGQLSCRLRSLPVSWFYQVRD